jgi:hypothetical protein
LVPTILQIAYAHAHVWIVCSFGNGKSLKLGSSIVSVTTVWEQVVWQKFDDRFEGINMYSI